MERNHNVIGPIDSTTWSMLRTYHSAIKYHKSIRNTKVIDMIEPIYREAKKGIY